MNHCIDCRHYVHNAKNLEYGLCGRTVTHKIYSDRYQKWVVSGEGDEPKERKFPMTYCTHERQIGGGCGPDGKFFEPHLLSATGELCVSAPRQSSVGNAPGHIGRTLIPGEIK